MNDQDLIQYSRHLLLDEFSEEIQQKLANSKILIVGAGGLGSSASLFLAASGIGKISVADGDKVDLTNLQRQIVHNFERIGKNKAISAKQTLQKINPKIEIVAVDKRLSAENLALLETLISQNDCVVDCCDNFETRYLINDLAMKHQKILVSGAAIKFVGQLTTFDFRSKNRGKKFACYNCLFPQEAENLEEIKCSLMGVFSPLVGIVGSYQAAETIKILGGVGENLVGKMLQINLLTNQLKIFKYRHESGCQICKKYQK